MRRRLVKQRRVLVPRVDETDDVPACPYEDFLPPARQACNPHIPGMDQRRRERYRAVCTRSPGFCTSERQGRSRVPRESADIHECQEGQTLTMTASETGSRAVLMSVIVAVNAQLLRRADV